MKMKITVAALLAAALLLFFGIRFYSSVQENEWKVQRNAVLTAYQKNILTKVSRVDNFVGDQPYTIIQGEDKIGQKLIVWVGSDNIYTQMASDGVTQDSVKALALARQPEADIMRIIPGVWNDTLVWEVFYKTPVEDTGSGHYFYDYFAFKDGGWMDTYRLSIQ
jgi:uncharacterized protein YpmB